MHFSTIFPFGLPWLYATLIAVSVAFFNYGLSLAYFQKEYPCSAYNNAQLDQVVCLGIAVISGFLPWCMTVTVFVVSKYWKHGFMLTTKKSKKSHFFELLSK